MEKNDVYYFHQTPEVLAIELLKSLNLQPQDTLYEPFKGEGAFYNHFPAVNDKQYTEITEGLDFKDFEGEYDWVITNPPFRLELPDNKRVNSFWYLLDYYSQRAKKGIAFLSNDKCFSTLTPKRMKTLHQRGWGVTKITVCSIKKWRGRYFFIVLEKKDGFLKHLESNF